MKIRIGTRGSNLALTQSRMVGRMLESAGAKIEWEIIKTVGDTLDIALTELGGKGVFVKEIDEALLEGRVDVAVHSMKDMPAMLPEGISVAAVPLREDARDAFISKVSQKLSGLPKGAKVGTSSPRRRAQVFRMRPDLSVVPMRGNVETRIRKLESGEVDALILAAAGLKRLGMENVITEYLPFDKMIPAIGQGALAIEVRSGERDLIGFVQKACHHAVSGIAVRAERALLKAIGGDCYTPLAAHAEIGPSGLSMTAFMTSADEARAVALRDSGAADQAAKIGRRLGETLLKKLGAR